MTRRCVLLLLNEPTWQPPGIAPTAWRRALAEDAVDLLATLAEVDTGLVATAADQEFADSVRWPGMPTLTVADTTVRDAFAAAGERGYEQAAVLATDAPDLPGMLIGKLLQPLGRRSVAAAPSGAGLLGIAACLPQPDWLYAANPDLDTTSVAQLRRAAPGTGQVATTQGWHRLNHPDGFAQLDPGLEGWEATRLLLAGQPG